MYPNITKPFNIQRFGDYHELSNQTNLLLVNGTSAPPVNATSSQSSNQIPVIRKLNNLQVVQNDKLGIVVPEPVLRPPEPGMYIL